MRDLGFRDVFTMSRILKKLQLKVEYTKGMTQNEFGAQLILKVFENLGDAEKEVTAFLADLKGVSVERIEKYDLEETFALIEEFKQIPKVNSFLQQAIKLTK